MRRSVFRSAAVLLLAAAASAAERETAAPGRPAGPITDGGWVRPNHARPAEPVWGVKGGIAVGLWPASGPRGLFRVYTPYLRQKHPRMVNYIAVEPVVRGVRGQSELEVSGPGKPAGLAMWAGDTAATVATPADPADPPAGRVERSGAAETLTVFVATEPFRNGARPVVQVMFRSDRPHEVGFRVTAAAGSARMDACVLTATMGNYARLRWLWLRGEVVSSGMLWPTFTPDRLGFAPWREWGRDRLLKHGGELIVAATSGEADPAGAAYDPAVPRHWRYEGKPATQYWRTADVAGAVARVNGRTTFWGGGGPIPGGVSYENFELRLPFADGQEVWFGVTPDGPASLGFDSAWEKNLTDGK